MCAYRPRWVHEGMDLHPRNAGQLRNPFLHYTTWNTADYLAKLDRYAALGVLNYLEEGEPGLLAMVFCLPWRFLQLYLLRLGFLDGVPGFQICMFTAFYSFLKKAKLWELRHAHPQPDPEAALDERQTIAFPGCGKTATGQSRVAESGRQSRVA